MAQIKNKNHTKIKKVQSLLFYIHILLLNDSNSLLECTSIPNKEDSERLIQQKFHSIWNLKSLLQR